MLRREKIALGLVAWLTLMAGLTISDYSSQSPSVQHDTTSNQGAYHAAGEKRPGPSPEEEIANYTWWLTFFTAILGASTIGLWITAIFTTRIQSRDMVRALEVMRQNMMWARGVARLMMESSERALQEGDRNQIDSPKIKKSANLFNEGNQNMPRGGKRPGAGRPRGPTRTKHPPSRELTLLREVLQKEMKRRTSRATRVPRRGTDLHRAAGS